MLYNPESCKEVYSFLSEGIVLSDLDFKIIYINPAGSRMVGIDRPHSIIGDSLDKYISIHPRYRDEFNNKLNKLRKQEISIMTENIKIFINTVGKNDLLDVSVISTLYLYDNKKVILHIFNDISEHKLSKDNLYIKLNLEKVVSKISSRFVGILDLDKNINDALKEIGTFCNASRAYIFFLAKDKKTMTNTHEWCNEGVSSQIDVLANLPTTDFPWWMSKLEQDEVIQISDITQLPSEAVNEKRILEMQDIKSVLVIPLRIKEEFAGYIGLDNVSFPGEWNDEDYYILKLIAKLFSNVFERSEVEEKLQSTLTKLKYAQAQLIQQEKLAAIGQLAAGVAHEINNPLGFVMSNFETLQNYAQKYKKILTLYRDCVKCYKKNNSSENDDIIVAIENMERKEHIEFIIDDLDELINDSMEGLTRVSKIVQGLKRFSRNIKPNTFEEYDLNKGIMDTLLIARNEIKYNANVETYLADIPNIKAIAGEINQVILNLLINASHAIKAKKVDNGLIKITTYSDSEFVYCKIKDTGIGISEENKMKIFEPFFTTKPMGEGTGLGLSIAYDIIANQHHGDILFESEEGQGTEFVLKIPIYYDSCDSEWGEKNG